MPSTLEPKGLCRRDDKRPDGLTLFSWSQGKSTVWDYTCHDTVCQSYIAGTSREARKAAEEAEQAKSNLYNELAADFNVIPVATETFGSWCPAGLKFIKEIGERMASRTGEKRSRYYLLQRISMAIQKGNVASIVGTVPSHRKLDKIFYL